MVSETSQILMKYCNLLSIQWFYDVVIFILGFIRHDNFYQLSISDEHSNLRNPMNHGNIRKNRSIDDSFGARLILYLLCHALKKIQKKKYYLHYKNKRTEK